MDFLKLGVTMRLSSALVLCTACSGTSEPVPGDAGARGPVDAGHATRDASAFDASATRDASTARDASAAHDGAPDEPRSRDVFGVQQLVPTAPGGLEWDARYWRGEAHDVPFGVADPADPGGLGNQRGEGEVTVMGDGTLRMRGSQPRLYIGTAQNHPWRNVEITVYYQRVEDDDTSYAGLVVGARSGVNGHGTDNCTATTYYARFRNDGDADVEKELEHPEAEARETTPLWEGEEAPHGRWIGMKYIVRNVDMGAHVRLQVFRDLSEGADGGSWEPVIDATDRGDWSPSHGCPYAEDLIVTEGGGVVLVRNTGTTGEGALYKWLTIREVEAD